MSYEYIRLDGAYKGYLGVLDTETLNIYRVHEERKNELGIQLNAYNGENNIEDNGFDTLILHISNDCNLNCRYCFAGHGSYRSSKGMMTEETVCKAIDCIYNKYSYIHEIKLFGGEPALNLSAIETAGKHVMSLYNKGKIIKLPKFKIITNGTIVNERFIELIKKYKISVVFSIDGPSEIHDAARIDRNGIGTFELVKNNFKKIRNATNDSQPYSIDVTFSHFHEQYGYSVNDTVKYLSETFGVRPNKINISLVSATNDDEYCLMDKNHFENSAVNAISNMSDGNSCVHMKLNAILKSLKKHSCAPENYCMAGGKWLAVSYTGAVYPCLMFMDRDEYYMGNVRENLFENEKYKKVNELFQNHKKKENIECRNCSFINLCSNCMGQNEFETGSIYHCTPNNCESKRKMIMTIVKGIAEGKISF